MDELSRLQDHAAQLPWAEVEQVLRSELGAEVESVFASFDHTPIAAASVAQVHVATLKSGEEVVVKVLRPEVRRVVEWDLDILARLARTLQRNTRWGRGIGTVELARGFAVALREELDLRIEVRNMLAIAAASAARNDRAGVQIPLPHEPLCTGQVLVMQRLEGLPITDATATLDSRGLSHDELARTLLESLLRQVMLDGVFHADPHPGNIMLLADGQFGLLDFGSVARIDA